jgi:hypothetical protein
MDKRWQVAVGSFLLVAAPCLQAAGIGKGDFEAGVSISISKGERNTDVEVCTGFGCTTTESSVDTEYGSVNASFGYFILDSLELKASVSQTVTADMSNGVFGPGADFVWLSKTGDVAPFAGAAYGLAYGDLPTDPTTGEEVDSDFLDVHGGIKFFFRERAAFEVKLTRFQPLDSDAETGRTELAAGINIYF